MIDMLDITTGKRDVRRYLSSSVILKTQVLLFKKSQSFPVDIKKNKLKWAGDLEGLKSFISDEWNLEGKWKSRTFDSYLVYDQ